MRLAVFLVMLMWTLDKFINPGHAGKIFGKFYFIAGLERTVLALHTVSTLLFFAAWPMLAGCLMLYLLRDEDVILSLNR
jgi:putative oxidoreductase